MSAYWFLIGFFVFAPAMDRVIDAWVKHREGNARVALAERKYRAAKAAREAAEARGVTSVSEIQNIIDAARAATK